MSIEIRIPELGENIEGGQVTALRVAVGDRVEAEQPLLEMETGKATLEVPAPSAGVISKLTISEGDEVQVGSVIGELDDGEPSAAEPKAQEAEEPPEEKPAAPAPQPVAKPSPSAIQTVDILIPELGENIEGGQVTTLSMSVGDRIEADQTLFEMETGKATLEVPAVTCGTLTEVLVKEGDQVTIGQVVARMSTSAAPAAEAPPTPENKPATPAPEAAPAFATPVEETVVPAAPAPKPVGRLVPASPSVRRLAREIGVHINEITGSGPKGRVTKDDVKKHSKALHQQHKEHPAATGSRPGLPPLPDFAKHGPIRGEKMSTIRKRTAEHMAMCWSQIPHVTQFDQADITELDSLRKKFAPRAEKLNGKLTITAMLIKIVASALKAFPKFNSSLDLEQQQIIFKDYIHIGIAAETPRGLLVPVIRDVPSKNMMEIAVEMTHLAAQTREGKVAPSDLEGGTFTITNLGGIGGTHFTPIVNWPQVAILGVGRAFHMPKKCEDKCEPSLTLPLSLSYDHRVIDGAEGARFLRWIVEAIEEPLLLSLEG